MLPVEVTKNMWPKEYGCVDKMKPIKLIPGDTFDRFGGINGSMVSPTGETIGRIAEQLGITGTFPNTFSYTERSLPYAGIDRNGNSSNKKRQNIYTISYTKNLINSKQKGDSLDYHIYKVLQPIEAQACLAAPAFEAEGGAIQIQFLNKTRIRQLLEKIVDKKTGKETSIIEELPVTEIPPYKKGDLPIQNNSQIQTELKTNSPINNSYN